MGNGVSRAASPGPKGSMKANALPLKPEPTPVMESRPKTSTPEMTPPATYQLLTPPPSGELKRPEASETSHIRPTAPPTPPDPRSPTLSPTLLGTPTPDSPFPRPTSFSSSHPSHSRPSTPCSRCRRRISHSQQQSPQRSKPQPTPPPAPCGHALCHRCLRATLLTSLSANPFTPASCPVRTCPPPPPPPPPNPASHPTSITTPTPTPPPNSSTTTTTTTTTTTATATQPCAAPLPLPTLGAVATPAEFLAYRDKLREMRTPPERRLYCHDREGCGMFLGAVAEARAGGGCRGEGVEGGSEGFSQGFSQGGSQGDSQGSSHGMMGRETGGRGRVAAVVCPLCGGRTCSGCGGRAHRFGGAGMGSQKDKLGRKRKRTVGSTSKANKRRKGEEGVVVREPTI